MNNENQQNANSSIAQQDVFDIQTQCVNMSQIFDKDRHYFVPNYQRGYAWREPQWEALWKDILNLLSSTAKMRHYMGMLSLANSADIDKNKHGIIDKRAFDIIDGQQRITTLIILINSLNKHLKDDKIKAKYISAESGVFKFNYILSGENKTYLKERVFNDKQVKYANAYQKNIHDAMEFFNTKVVKLEDKNTFFACIVERLEFNLFFNSEHFDTRMTFETMNYRGKSLTKLEILKNRLLYLSTGIVGKTELLTITITDAWTNIYNNLGLNPDAMLSDDRFLKAHWLIFGKKSRNIKAKGDSYSEDILDTYFPINNEGEPRSYEDIFNYVESLSESSVEWFKLNYPKLSKHFTNEEEEIKLLDRLSRIRDLEFVKALILATLKQKQYISDDKRIELYDVLEKYIYINFCIVKNNNRNDMSFCSTYGQSIFQCRDKAENDATIMNLIKELKETHGKSIKNIMPEILKLLENDTKQYYFWRMPNCRYLLYEYDESLNIPDKSIKELQWESFKMESIEHILPQKVKAASWKHVLKEYSDNIDIVTQSIGNLVGLTINAKNSSLSNKGYRLKCMHDKYSYRLGTRAERKIANSEVWTARHIYDRSVELLNFIYGRWLKDYLPQSEFDASKYIGFTVVEDAAAQQVLETELKSIYNTET